MSTKKLLVDFVTVFAGSLIVSAIVTSQSNLFFHGASTIDWGASFGFAILFGIVLALIGTRRSNCRKDSRALLSERCAPGQEPVG
jgi:hypothetical protein